MYAIMVRFSTWDTNLFYVTKGKMLIYERGHFWWCDVMWYYMYAKCLCSNVSLLADYVWLWNNTVRDWKTTVYRHRSFNDILGMCKWLLMVYEAAVTMKGVVPPFLLGVLAKKWNVEDLKCNFQNSQHQKVYTEYLSRSGLKVCD